MLIQISCDRASESIQFSIINVSNLTLQMSSKNRIETGKQYTETKCSNSANKKTTNPKESTDQTFSPFQIPINHSKSPAHKEKTEEIVIRKRSIEESNEEKSDLSDATASRKPSERAGACEQFSEGGKEEREGKGTLFPAGTMLSHCKVKAAAEEDQYFRNEVSLWMFMFSLLI